MNKIESEKKYENIFLELKERFDLDQELIKKEKLDDYYANCKNNSKWLEWTIKDYGWLSDNKVWKHWEMCAWLITQHSPNLDFQKLCLFLLKKLPKTKERNNHICYLEDRILVYENKKQIYWTQFDWKGNPSPIENEDNLEKRRKEMWLWTFKEYLKQMQIN